MNVLDIKVSWFADLYNNNNGDINTREIGSILNCIGKGAIHEQIERIRRAPNKKTRDTLKLALPVITWQGIFKHRADNGLASLSSLICIDIDHRTNDELTVIQNELRTWNFVVAFFLSPSGDGLKVIIKTDLRDSNYYLNCYKQLEKLFVDRFGIEPDSKCEILSQGCFMSYDPGLYVNIDVEDWHFTYDPTFDKHCQSSKSWNLSSGGYQQEVPISAYAAFMNQLGTIRNNMTDEQIIQILDRKFHGYKQNYVDGNRTKAIFVQASILCKAGISQEKAINYLKDQFLQTGYKEYKLVHEASQAYNKNCCSFGSERGNYLPYDKYKSKKKL